MRRIVGIFFLLVVWALPGIGQDFSNRGKEFWLGYGNHQEMFLQNRQGMDVYITGDEATTAIVEIPGTGFSRSVNITPNQVVAVTIPQNAILDMEGRSNLGIHVVAERPVVVYAHIYFASVSGATLVLPVSTLGREYYSINFTQVAQPSVNSNSYSYFFVVATEDNTTVEITPSATTVGGRAAGVTFTETLNRGQVYQVLSLTDLTGSEIRSVNAGGGCKKIAVFSGAGRIGIGCASANQISSDNLFQQAYPSSTWGRRYITVPSAGRPRNFYRIIRPDPTAVVRVNGRVIAPNLFTNNFYHQIETTELQVIESDKPIMVAQYFTTQNCGEPTGIGDPEMIFLNPLEQTINDVTLTSMRLIQPQNTQNNRHYINVVLKNLPQVIQSFRVDGAPYSAFTPLPQDPNYAYAQIPVQEGTHRLLCDSGFNAIAYGFAQTESYGYSAGTNLRDLFQFITVNNVLGSVNFPASCRNAPFTFSIVFPYQPLNIRWRFNGLFNDTTLVNPVFDSTWEVSGRRLYRYTIRRPYTVPSIGTFPINIIATNPTADGCGGEQEIDYDLQIFEQPRAEFTVTHNQCIDDSVRLFDATSTAGGRPVSTWYWQTGDQQVYTTRNPVHLYRTAGEYRVRMAIVTDIGCLSDTASRTLSVFNLPTAAFRTPDTTCDNNNIVLTDASAQAGAGTLASWTWTVQGGGASVTNTDNRAFSLPSNAAGQYIVSLQVRNAAGCQSPLFRDTITVHPTPIAGFGLPEVCLNDAFAQFSDSSTIAGNTPRLYNWLFGDGSAGTDANPRHRYTAVGNYTVVQVVRTAAGCADTATRTFTVNGAVPRAAVELVGTGANCSNQELVIRNASSVDFGGITRLEILWDATGAPAVVETDEQPTPGKTYRFLYPDFGGNQPRNYTVRVRAYSGISCFSDFTQQVTIQPSPQLRFDDIPPFCQDAAPLDISTRSGETSGLTGTAVYSGPGVQPGNLFNPSAAAIGTNRIRYTFTGGNGCTAFLERDIIVHPLPVVDAGPDRTVLEGGFITLNAQASGTGLRYAWSPPTALDNPTLLSPQASPVVDTRYTLTVTTANGCSASDALLVTVLKRPVIPNTFTPNGDGFNDRWEIRFLDTYPGAVVEVYNTAGQLVFRSVGYNQPWDGTMNGRPLPAGTYYYVVDAKNGRPKVAGYVTLIK
jgi:gliding motility-associated-like protein